MTLKSIITLGALIGLSSADVFFKETFSDKDWEKRWVQSKWKEDMGKFEWSSGKLWNVDPELEKGMQASEDAKFYGISSLFDKPTSNKDQDLVLQFSVKNEGKSSSFCGGGYIKLLPSSLNQKTFGGESPYLIMFGPDICGYDVSRIHVIFNYDGKNLLKKEDIKLEYDDKNDLTHLYTLVVHPDNTYEVFFDQKSKAKGSLLDGWDFPQKTIPDPEDRKPSDWVDEEFIDDPEARKPDGWDDIPEMIPDSTAVKPEDWDEEDDGKWEAPLIKNPEFKGEWEPKRIPNPEFKGRWVQKTVSNPNYREDVYKYEDIGAVGYELWIVNKGSIFDNIFVGNSLEEAKKFADETFGKIKEKEKDAKDKYEASKKTEEKVEEEDDDDDKETDSQEKEEL